MLLQQKARRAFSTRSSVSQLQLGAVVLNTNDCMTQSAQLRGESL